MKVMKFNLQAIIDRLFEGKLITLWQLDGL